MPKGEKLKIRKKSVEENPIYPSYAMEKMEKALDDLGEHWMWQNEFMEYYRLTPYVFRRYSKYFRGYRVKCGQRYIWTGSKATAKKMKGKC